MRNLFKRIGKKVLPILLALTLLLGMIPAALLPAFAATPYSITQEFMFTRYDSFRDGFYGAALDNGVVYAIRVWDDYQYTSTGDSHVPYGDIFTIYAFDLYNNELWHRDFFEEYSAVNAKCVVGQDGSVYLECRSYNNENIAIALNPDGTLRWEKLLDNSSSMGTDPILVEVDGEQKLIFTTRSYVQMLNPEDGETIWKSEGFPEGYGALSGCPPVEKGGRIFLYLSKSGVTTSDSYIQAISLTGDFLWQRATPTSCVPAFASDGAVYVGDTENNILSLDPANGDVIRTLVLSDTGVVIRNLKTTPSGRLYTCIAQGYNYSWQAFDYEAGDIIKNPVVYSGINFMDLCLTVDKEGYLYYRGGGNQNEIIAYAPGNGTQQAARVPVIGSSQNQYTDLIVEGNVIIGTRKASTDICGVYVGRITRDETPGSVSILQKGKQFGVNMTELLGVTVKNENGDAMLGQELEWMSSDTDVAEVTADGKFFCKQTGSFTATVTVAGTALTDSVEVTVVEKDPEPYSIEILGDDGNPITGQTVTIDYKSSYAMGYAVRDQYGNVMPGEQVAWFSLHGNEGFNYVNKQGVYNPLRQAWTTTDTVTVKSVANRNITAQTTIKNEKAAAIFSDILPIDLVMPFPGTLKVAPASQYQELMTVSGITWTVSDESIATVAPDGTVTSKKEGTVTITAAADDKTFSRELTVVPSFGYDGIMASVSSSLRAVADDGSAYSVASRVSLGKDPTGETTLNVYKVPITASDPDGNEKWSIDFTLLNLNVRTVKVGPDGDLYAIYSASEGSTVVNYSVARFSSADGTLLYASAPYYSGTRSPLSNMLFTADGSKLYAFIRDTRTTWTVLVSAIQTADGELALDDSYMTIWEALYNTLDIYIYGQDRVFFPVANGNDTDIIVLTDTGSSMTETSYTLPLVNLTYNAGMVESGILYAGFTDKDGTDRAGLCAIGDESIAWKYYAGEREAVAAQSVYATSDRIYFLTSKNNGSASTSTAYREYYTLYAVEKASGELIWKKSFADMNADLPWFAPNKIVTDADGNIYMTMSSVTMVSVMGSIMQKSASHTSVVSLDPNGDITRMITYPVAKFGEFTDLCLVGENVYAISSSRVVRFPFENNRDQAPDMITLSAAKNSLIAGDTLQMKPVVYSQLGNIMQDVELVWSSSKPENATVDENGVVTGLTVGTNIVVTAAYAGDLNVKATFTISVVEAGLHHVSTGTVADAAQKIVNHYKTAGVLSDWVAFGLNAAGENINEAPYLIGGRSYLDGLRDIVRVTDFTQMTDYERTVMAVLSGGLDPANFGGKNLLEKIYNSTAGMPNNGAIWALIALDAADAVVPDGGTHTRESLIQFILDNKSGDGWSYAGGPDPDMTSMALYALAPYKDRPDVAEAIDKALIWLQSVQLDNGSFSYDAGETGIVNTESTAQVIMALTALGIDPQGNDYTKSGGNPVSALLTNQLSSGAFEHVKGTGADNMSTEQALQALASLGEFYKDGVSNIFYHIPYTKVTQEQDNADISAAKTLVQNAAYTATQAQADNADAAKTRVEAILSGLSLGDVTATVEGGAFTAATAGTPGSVNGVNGSYTFTVKLNKGAGAEQTYSGTLAITATPYDPAQDNADIFAAKTLVQNTAYTATQVQASDAASAKAKVEAIIGGLNLNGVTVTVPDGVFTAAMAGTADNVNGTNGSYTFTVKLNKGAGTEQTYSGALTITAAPYQADGITVAISVEKFTVNGEYILEPILLTLPKDSNVSNALVEALGIKFPGVAQPYRAWPGLTYFSGIWDPDYSSNLYPGYLNEFDEGFSSGWKYCVGNVFPNIGASVKTLSDGDVVRWQYTQTGDFAGVEDVSAPAQPANKDALTWSVAEINMAGDKEDYGAAYTNAMTVLKTLGSTQKQADDALTALNAVKEGEDDSEEAKKVDDLIAKIGDPVTLAEKAKIGEARAAYNALTDTQKDLVTKLDQLKDAEAKLGDLQAANKPNPTPGDEQSKSPADGKQTGTGSATGDHSAAPTIAAFLLLALCAGGYLYSKKRREENSL